MTTRQIDVRRATEADAGAVLDLLAVSLGWAPEDPTAELFAWKHTANPFGLSPAWVALAGDRVVGYRTFMRWRFRWEGTTVDAVRAVDTATHPDYRGRGLFRLLTTQALDDLRDEGVGFVFNTPNDQSRPGYLKMGWQVVGRLPVAARPRGPAGLRRMARARRPADLWSVPTPVGEQPERALCGVQVAGVEPEAASGGLATDRDAGFLAWRYGFQALHYRVWRDDARGALLVFRLRRRAAATELALLDVLGRPGRGCVRRLLAATRADYAIGLGAARPRGAAPIPGQGPLLTWRALAVEQMPPLDRWSLNLGDVELF